jgi:hypothetical protein
VSYSPTNAGRRSVSLPRSLGSERERQPPRTRDWNETVAETINLKLLARRVLDRGTSRDTVRDGVFRGNFAHVDRVRQRPAVSVLGESAPSLGREVPAGNGEPGLRHPCATRRGRLEELPDGSLLHFCTECGAWGAFGYGINMRAGRPGRWFCAAHRPQGAAP